MNASGTTYYLPRETAEVCNDERIKQCKNLSLLLHKYPPQAVIQSSARKNQWLRTLISNSLLDADLALHAYRRWHAMTTAAQAQCFHAKTDWHLAQGLSNETVLETDLTVHPLYGLPFIPGSALKGLCRNYVTGEISEHLSKNIDEDDEIVQRIFGTPDQSGSVIFFDALPVEGKATFALDIINVHYPDYYSRGKAPINDQRPNPLLFLTVADTIFAFALAPRTLKYSEQNDDVMMASQWLQEALQEWGIGGKTSAGYGYLTSQSVT
jgi:CRISPR type III-B/RAMP module RAMP protein Cmr6